jgi:hypothetical protein
MRTLKVICTVTVLSLVLSAPVHAGDISTPGITTPVPITGSPSPAPSGTSSPDEALPSSTEFDAADFFEFVLSLVF